MLSEMGYAEQVTLQEEGNTGVSEFAVVLGCGGELMRLLLEPVDNSCREW